MPACVSRRAWQRVHKPGVAAAVEPTRKGTTNVVRTQRSRCRRAGVTFVSVCVGRNVPRAGRKKWRCPAVGMRRLHWGEGSDMLQAWWRHARARERYARHDGSAGALFAGEYRLLVPQRVCNVATALLAHPSVLPPPSHCRQKMFVEKRDRRRVSQQPCCHTMHSEMPCTGYMLRRYSERHASSSSTGLCSCRPPSSHATDDEGGAWRDMSPPYCAVCVGV